MDQNMVWDFNGCLGNLYITVSTLEIREKVMEFSRTGKDKLYLDNGRGIDFYKLYD